MKSLIRVYPDDIEKKASSILQIPFKFTSINKNSWELKFKKVRGIPTFVSKLIIGEIVFWSGSDGFGTLKEAMYKVKTLYLEKTDCYYK